MVILIQQSSDTPVRPRDIDTDDTLLGTFGGDRDAELAAFWIVRLCQRHRSWRPFPISRLTSYIHVNDGESSDEQLMAGLAVLTEKGLVRSDKGAVTLTTAFVATCYKAHPVQGMPRRKYARASRKTDKVSKYQRIKGEDPFQP